MVRTWVMVLMVLLMAGVASAAVDFNDLHLSVWPMANDVSGEIRLGGQYKAFEAYFAPRYDSQQIDTENDFLTAIRAYGFYNAFDANMVAYLLDDSMPLPTGSLYGGFFAGYAIDGGTMEFGWAIGGRVQLYQTMDLLIEGCVEYQKRWTSISRSAANEYTVSGGPRFRF